MLQTVAIVPTLIISLSSRYPVANAVPAAAPAHGNRMPTAFMGMSMVIEAGLNPTSEAMGMKIPENSEVAARI